MPACRLRCQLCYERADDAGARCVAELRRRTRIGSILCRRELHCYQLQSLRHVWVQVCRYLHLGRANHRPDRSSARLRPDVAAGMRQETSPPGGRDFGALQQSRLYDVLMRLPMLIWSVFLGIVTVLGLQQYIRETDPTLPGAVYVLNIAMRVSVIAYLAVIAATVAVSSRPAQMAFCIDPPISALIGTFQSTVFVLFPHRDLSII